MATTTAPRPTTVRTYTDSDRMTARAQAEARRAARAAGAVSFTDGGAPGSADPFPRPTYADDDLATFAKAKPKGTTTPPTDEKGAGGRPTWYGELLGSETDHVAAWQLPGRWTTIPKMLGDPDVAAVLSAITLPLRAVTMTVEPGSKDPAAVDAAAFIQRDLENMTTSLAGHRAEVLDYLPWGVTLFETVYKRSADDGLYHLRKLASRPADTIERWLLDDTGGPAGVVQAAARGGTRDMDMERLIAFTHNRRGGDLTGRSLLRPVYGPWMLKTELAKTGAVAAYRNGVGIPTIRYTGDDEATHTAYQTMLMGLHAHAKGFMLLTDLDSIDDFKIKGVDGALVDPVPQMQHHRAAVYTATLCQFLLLGTGDTGSFALSADHSSFLLLALQAVLDEIADTYNRYMIPRMVGYNWGSLIAADAMPRVTFGRLDRAELTGWFNAVKTAREAGITLTPRALEEKAHERLGLPLPEYADEHPDGGVADVNNPNDDGNEEASGDDPVTPGATGATGFTERRPVRSARVVRPAAATTATLAEAPARLESLVKLEALGIRPRFVEMSEAMDDAAARLKRKLAALQAKAADYAIRKALEAAKKGDPSILLDMALSGDQEAEAIAEELGILYDRGVGEVDDELGQQGVKAKRPAADDDKANRAVLAAVGAVMAAMLVDRMLTAARMAGIGQIAAGTADRSAIEGRVNGAPDSLLGDLSSRAVAIGLGNGRGAALTANADKVDRVMYSAAMDANTCPTCGGLDGKEYAVDDAPAIPNPDCDGREKCRCGLVPIASGTGRGTTGDDE